MPRAARYLHFFSFPSSPSQYNDRYMSSRGFLFFFFFFFFSYFSSRIYAIRYLHERLILLRFFSSFFSSALYRRHYISWHIDMRETAFRHDILLQISLLSPTVDIYREGGRRRHVFSSLFLRYFAALYSRFLLLLLHIDDVAVIVGLPIIQQRVYISPSSFSSFLFSFPSIAGD